MNCSEVRKWLSPYVDGEVDLIADQEIRGHLGDCPECRAEKAALRALCSSVSALSRHTAPEGLAAKVMRPARVPRARPILGLVFAFAAGAAAALLAVAFLVPRAAKGPDLAARVLDSHLEAMMTGHIMDVVSSDRHTVKPWIQGKAPVAPTPWDLKAEGYPLAGARLAYLGDRSAVALVYRRAKHWIDLYVLPEEGSGESWTAERRGYALAAWTQGGLEYVAASDVQASELAAFVDDYKSKR